MFVHILTGTMYEYDVKYKRVGSFAMMFDP